MSKADWLIQRERNFASPPFPPTLPIQSFGNCNFVDPGFESAFTPKILDTFINLHERFLDRISGFAGVTQNSISNVINWSLIKVHQGFKRLFGAHLEAIYQGYFIFDEIEAYLKVAQDLTLPVKLRIMPPGFQTTNHALR